MKHRLSSVSLHIFDDISSPTTSRRCSHLDQCTAVVGIHYVTRGNLKVSETLWGRIWGTSMALAKHRLVVDLSETKCAKNQRER